MGGDAAIAEAKHDAKAASAPLQLMTQFLRAVSEDRMEDALALAQTSEIFRVQLTAVVREKSNSSSTKRCHFQLKAREDPLHKSTC